FEYFSDYGTVAATENRINSIIDTMNLQYENEVAITHQITTIIVRSSSNDPYSSFDAGNFLGQFRSHWINNQQSVQRDVAHLFTGKNLNGGTIGVAYLGAICSTNLGYGLVESDCCGSFATKTDLSAHELGHNWNADHCSCSSPNYTMNPFLTAANRFSPTQTIPAMINYAANRPCLDDGSTGGPDPVIDNISPFFVTAVDPNAPVQVVVNGSGFNGADEVAIDGVPLPSFPPQFQIVDDGEIRITLLPPQDVGVKVISVTEGSVTASANLSVVFNANPTIDLVNSDPDFLLSFVPIEVHMGAVQGDIHFLLASTENIPTSVPGVFDVAIGNNLSSLFLLGDFAIGSTGNRTFSTPLVGLGSGTKLYFQSVVFDASNPVLPLAASNVESGTILF
ncbi:MAG: M12 family metallo-peptidase, partial [Planctomycetota bacterium]